MKKSDFLNYFFSMKIIPLYIFKNIEIIYPKF